MVLEKTPPKTGTWLWYAGQRGPDLSADPRQDGAKGKARKLFSKCVRAGTLQLFLFMHWKGSLVLIAICDLARERPKLATHTSPNIKLRKLDVGEGSSFCIPKATCTTLPPTNTVLVGRCLEDHFPLERTCSHLFPVNIPRAFVRNPKRRISIRPLALKVQVGVSMVGTWQRGRRDGFSQLEERVNES